ncbi:hypothetical protein K491DRAFT_689340 [Lophiostoma macrostomum CBS 122681]|uniref:Rhodopsin domain-containing protein n=1 Tax=Lophiostoma macrostomum CBS 122681 TaxID=1314788 RepID=A0A6A6TIG6_9PLEO|nr:hypothetical protein K491DRAFT_689340 [Lophiostoma macrostomum CBS 122681]
MGCSCWASLILAISSSVCLHLSVKRGLGGHYTSISESHADAMYKLNYAAELMSVAAIGTAKANVIMLCDRIATARARSYYIVLAVVTAWFVFALLATAFQCPLPQPWNVYPSRCPSHYRIQYPIIGLNVLTDALLAMWILPTLSMLLMDSSKRGSVLFLFGARIFVCGFAIVQLITVIRHNQDADITCEWLEELICVVHLSVLLATIPRTNRFIPSLQSTRLTDFELSSKHSTSNPGALPTAPDKSHRRGRSTSDSGHSNRSLVDLPLKLTPSLERNFRTHITSQTERHEDKSEKDGVGDWRRYIGRAKDDEVRTAFGEHIIQTREVTQEIEVVAPQKSKWTIAKPRRLSRGTK